VCSQKKLSEYLVIVTCLRCLRFRAWSLLLPGYIRLRTAMQYLPDDAIRPTGRFCNMIMPLPTIQCDGSVIFRPRLLYVPLKAYIPGNSILDRIATGLYENCMWNIQPTWANVLWSGIYAITTKFNQRNITREKTNSRK